MPDGGAPDRHVAPVETVVPDEVAAQCSSCAACGTTASARPITWSLQVDDRGATWLCDVCTRRDLRSIESRLDEAWW